MSIPMKWSRQGWCHTRFHAQAAKFAALLLLLVVPARVTAATQSDAVSPSLEGLVRAVEGYRPTEGRLSGGFAYASYDPGASSLTNGRVDGPFVSTLARIAARIESAATIKPSAENVRAKALLHLVYRQWDPAIEMLRRAIALDSQKPTCWSDLSAALIAKSVRDGRPHLLVEALDASERALNLEPHLKEARFNKALALEKLFLRNDAIAAWSEYAQRDSDSGWGRAARRRLNTLKAGRHAAPWSSVRCKLTRPMVEGDVLRAVALQYPRRFREYLQRDVLAAWAQSLLDGRKTDAEAHLLQARRMASLVLQLSGDRLPADAVAAIDDALEDPAGGEARPLELAHGYSKYSEGRTAMVEFDNSKALVTLEEAHTALRNGDSALQYWAAFFLGVAAHQATDYARAEAIFETTFEQVETQPYLNLLGRLYWERGQSRRSDANLAKAIDFFRSGISMFERTGEEEAVAALHALTSEDLQYMGLTEEAWVHRYRAASILSRYDEPRRWYVLWDSAATGALAQGADSVALYFYDELIRTALRREDWPTCALSTLAKASALVSMGETNLAAKELEKVETYVARIPDENLRYRPRANYQVVKGLLLAETNPGLAIGPLTEALDHYGNARHYVDPVRLYVARAKAHFATGRVESGEADLETAIEELELQRVAVSQERFRVSYLDRWRLVFSEMARFQIDRRADPASALQYVERARARTLLDALSSSQHRGTTVPPRFEPLSVDGIRESLAPDAALIEYVLLPDRLLAWVVTNTKLESAVTWTTEAHVRSLVARLSAQLELFAPPEQYMESATALYDLLIRPIRPFLERHSILILVPGPSLSSLPFAALLDDGTGRFLVEDWSILTAPSASVYAAASRNRKAVQPVNLLIVANPSIDRRRYTRLPQLDAAEENAPHLAALYETSRTLLRKAATKDAFLSAAPGYQVIHFAGHAISDGPNPVQSRLLMASSEEQGDSGELRAGDLSNVNLSSTRLVVLAACSTAAGPNASTEGIGPLVRPFLAAGANAVVASLWRVDDDSTARFFLNFHQYFTTSGSALGALGRTQRHFLRSADPRVRHPSTWAAFTIVGGSLNFD